MTFQAKGCVVIGSGPSLGRIDLSHLASIDTMAFNRSYLAWPEWGFAPTHYCCLDSAFLAHNHAELSQVMKCYTTTLFHLNARAASFGMPAEDRIAWVVTADSQATSDLTAVREFGNVGASSLQVLARRGYRRIVLVGVDGVYRAGVTHFRPDYSQGLWTMPLPDADTIREQWRQAMADCAGRGVAVRNASPGTALDVVPTLDFAKALNWVRS